MKKANVCEPCSDVLYVELNDVMKACDLIKLAGNALCLWTYAVCNVFSACVIFRAWFSFSDSEGKHLF